jgi:hypothetical protein
MNGLCIYEPYVYACLRVHIATVTSEHYIFFGSEYDNTCQGQENNSLSQIIPKVGNFLWKTCHDGLASAQPCIAGLMPSAPCASSVKTKMNFWCTCYFSAHHPELRGGPSELRGCHDFVFVINVINIKIGLCWDWIFSGSGSIISLTRFRMGVSRDGLIRLDIFNTIVKM